MGRSREKPGHRRVQVNPATRLRIYAREGGLCAWCGRDLRQTGAHIDHLVYEEGPHHERSPLALRAVASCPDCNGVRGNCGGRIVGFQWYLGSFTGINPPDLALGWAGRMIWVGQDYQDVMQALRYEIDTDNATPLSAEHVKAIKRASDTRERWPEDEEIES